VAGFEKQLPDWLLFFFSFSFTSLKNESPDVETSGLLG